MAEAFCQKAVQLRFFFCALQIFVLFCFVVNRHKLTNFFCFVFSGDTKDNGFFGDVCIYRISVPLDSGKAFIDFHVCYFSFFFLKKKKEIYEKTPLSHFFFKEELFLFLDSPRTSTKIG